MRLEAESPGKSALSPAGRGVGDTDSFSGLTGRRMGAAGPLAGLTGWRIGPTGSLSGLTRCGVGSTIRVSGFTGRESSLTARDSGFTHRGSSLTPRDSGFAHRGSSLARRFSGFVRRGSSLAPRFSGFRGCHGSFPDPRSRRRSRAGRFPASPRSPRPGGRSQHLALLDRPQLLHQETAAEQIRSRRGAVPSAPVLQPRSYGPGLAKRVPTESTVAVHATAKEPSPSPPLTTRKPPPRAGRPLRSWV
jgi:hypothetical protein